VKLVCRTLNEAFVLDTSALLADFKGSYLVFHSELVDNVRWDLHDKEGLQHGKKIDVHWQGDFGIVRHEWLHMLKEQLTGDNDPRHLSKSWWSIEEEMRTLEGVAR
jgi:hypothetical protein